MGAIDDSKNYLRPNQVVEMQSRLTVLEKQLYNPYVQDKGAVANAQRNIRRDLETQSPPDLKGLELDQAVREEKELREKITESMLSSEEMRKNPPGTVGRNLEWHKKFVKTGMVRKLKNRILAIHKGSDDPDIANLERFRPKTSQLNMDNAQIPGKSWDIPTEQFKEGHDQVNWSGQTQEQMQAEMDDLRAKLAAVGAAPAAPAKVKQVRGPLSEDHKAAMKAGRKKAREARAWKRRPVTVSKEMT